MLLVRVYRGADWLDGAGWATFALLASTTWFLPWYFVWFLPLAALSRRPSQKVVALVLTALIIALQAPTLLSPPGRHDGCFELHPNRLLGPALTKSPPPPGACKRPPAR